MEQHLFHLLGFFLIAGSGILAILYTLARHLERAAAIHTLRVEAQTLRLEYRRRRQAALEATRQRRSASTSRAGEPGNAEHSAVDIPEHAVRQAA